MNEEKNIRWVSANDLIEAQTRQIEKIYKSSRPKPSNARMGFKPLPRRRYQPDIDRLNKI